MSRFMFEAKLKKILSFTSKPFNLEKSIIRSEKRK